MMTRILDQREVERLKRSTLYQELAERNLPKPVRVGKRGVRWFDEETRDRTTSTRPTTGRSRTPASTLD